MPKPIALGFTFSGGKIVIVSRGVNTCLRLETDAGNTNLSINSGLMIFDLP